MDSAERPLALTLGDPAGIGPDITLLAYAARRSAPVPPFVLIGDPSVLAQRARTLGLDIEIATVGEAAEAPSLFAKTLPVLPVSVAGDVVAGRPDSAAAGAVQRSIERAVELVRA